MKDEIIQFLKENIIGKTLLTGAVYKLENGNLEGVYNDKMTFSNLVTTGKRFQVRHDNCYPRIGLQFG